MILYDPDDRMGFIEFGIEIPIFDSKASRAFDVLRKDPELGPRRQGWHAAHITETLSKADLTRVHGHGYIDRLFSEDLEKEIVRTYELIDDAGRYYRYNPQKARRPLARQSLRSHAVPPEGARAGSPSAVGAGARSC